MSNSAVRFVQPTDALIESIAANIRASDLAEIWLSHKFLPLEGVQNSVKRSRDDCFVAVADEAPLCIFGVASSSLTALRGSPWMIGTDTLAFYKQEVRELSRPMINYLRGGYALLENWVHVDNLVSVRWLESCGFTVEPAEPHGPFGALFHHFSMPGSLVCVPQPQ